MKTGIFLQARMNSLRLPGKALLELIDGNVIQHAMRALRIVPADVYALLTDAKSIPFFNTFAHKEGFDLFAGPADDVLARYCMAARHYGTDIVVRATGDNPLVSPLLTGQIIERHKNEYADLSHFLGMPLGTGVEAVLASALFESEKRAFDPFEREHITTHMYRNKDRFKVIEPLCDPDWHLPDIKVSIDTEAEYRFIYSIYSQLYKGVPIEITSLVPWLKQNKDVYGCQQKNQDNENPIYTK